MTTGNDVGAHSFRSRARLLTAASRAFAEAGDSPERLFDALVHDVAEGLGCVCILNLLTEDGAHFSARHIHAPNDAHRETYRGRLVQPEPLAVADYPALRHAVETRAPFHREETEETGVVERAAPELARFLREVKARSILMVPLVLRERVVGVLGMMRVGDGAPPFDADDVVLAQSLAEQASLALAAADALAAASRELAAKDQLAEHLQLLADASHDFAEATGDHEALLARIAYRLGSALGDLCTVRAVAEDGATLESGAAWHADAEVVSLARRFTQRGQALGEGISGKVVATGETVFVPHLAPETFLASAPPELRQILERLRAQSLIAAPLRCREKVVGVAILMRSGDAPPYTEEDVRLAAHIADHAALALLNTRSYAAEHAARTAQVVALEALHRSEVAHRLLFEASPLPLLVFDVDTLEIAAVNAAALNLYGYDPGELIGSSITAIGVDKNLENVRQRVSGLGEREVTGTVRHMRKDGTTIVTEYTSRPHIFGTRRARIVVIRDLTSQHEADETKALLAAIVASSNDAIVSKRLDGTITSWNGAAERLFGWPASEALGSPITLIIPDELLDEERDLLRRVRRSERVEHYQTIRVRKDGSRVPVSISLAPILDGTGAVVGASKTARDLTAQRAADAALKKAESQLRHAQKMEAVGRLAGGIAHDFNNVLSVVLSYSDMILADLPPDDAIGHDVEEIRTAANRAADLTRQLLMFSRQQVIAPKILDLNEILGALDKMLKRLLGEDVELVIRCGSPLGLVRADRGNVEQVIMNLVVNARDAMPTGGKLTVETGRVVHDEDFARAHPGSKPGPHVMLAVSDTGIGMDAATQARIFEPFFTTKDAGRGTGLGLSTVFGIAQQSGGSVWVYSELGHGTTLKVYFPEVEASPETTDVVAPKLRHGHETVLLVEDQAQVRHVAQGILQRAGYEVLAAPGAEAALALAEAFGGPIHVLLTDVVMPHMSGAELAKRISELRPDIKVLCMSGYTDDSIVRHGVLKSGLAFLQKPFTPESLTAKLREVLDADTPRFFGGT